MALTEMERVKLDVAVGNRILAEMGLASGLRSGLGHASMRVPGEPDKFVVKGRGYRIDALDRMRPEDMVVCDLEGNWLDGPSGSSQCGEVKIHSCIYRTHPEIQSVVHVHPKFVVLMTVLGKPLRPMAQEGSQLFERPLPLYPWTKTVTSEEEGQEVAQLLADGRMVLMKGHGAITTGRTVQESVMMMIHLEHQAEYNYLAYAAMGPDHPSIPDELIAEIADAPRDFPEPHFRDRVAQVGPPRNRGIWHYLVETVSADM